MSVKIRLQRHGKKGKPFFHIVVADSRSRRDGRFIEKLGTYNPITNPATIELNVDAAVKWLNVGAQPTDTARAILSYKGTLYKKHLQGGVAKGAFDETEADKKFAAWLEEKEKAVEGKKSDLTKTKDAAKKAALDAETKVNEARAAAAQKVLDDAKAEQEAKDAEAKAAKEAEEQAAADAKAKEDAASSSETATEPAEAATEPAPAEEAKSEEAASAEEKTVVETAAEKIGGIAAAVAGAVSTVKETVAEVAEKVTGAVAGKTDEAAEGEEKPAEA